MSKIFVIDTETGGTDDERHSILTLGGVIWTPHGLGPEIHVSIREPEYCVTPVALQINGIDLVHHEGMPPEDAAYELLNFLRDHKVYEVDNKSRVRVVLGGHNIGFDVGFLQRLFRLAKMPKELHYDKHFHYRTIDIASIARGKVITGQGPEGLDFGASLENICEAYGVPLERAHNALEDARATARCMSALHGLPF